MNINNLNRPNLQRTVSPWLTRQQGKPHQYQYSIKALFPVSISTHSRVSEQQTKKEDSEYSSQLNVMSHILRLAWAAIETWELTAWGTRVHGSQKQNTAVSLSSQHWGSNHQKSNTLICWLLYGAIVLLKKSLQHAQRPKTVSHMDRVTGTPNTAPFSRCSSTGTPTYIQLT